jgi:hypothetical protein
MATPSRDLPQAHIVVLREFFDWLGAEATYPAHATLEKLALADHDPLATTLARQLHARPPRAIRRPITPLGALGLAVAAINVNAVATDLDPVDTQAVATAADLFAQQRVRGAFDSPQQAAFAAVRQIGPEFGISAEADAELGSGRTASAETLQRVINRAQNDRNWYIHQADHLGVVLLDLSELPLPGSAD